MEQHTPGCPALSLAEGYLHCLLSQSGLPPKKLVCLISVVVCTGLIERENFGFVV